MTLPRSDLRPNVGLGQRLGHAWSVPTDQVPTDPADISNRLFDQWEDVDRWIAEHRAEALGAT